MQNQDNAPKHNNNHAAIHEDIVLAKGRNSSPQSCNCACHNHEDTWLGKPQKAKEESTYPTVHQDTWIHSDDEERKKIEEYLRTTKRQHF